MGHIRLQRVRGLDRVLRGRQGDPKSQHRTNTEIITRHRLADLTRAGYELRAGLIGSRASLGT